MLKGLRALQHVIAELKHITTPTKLLARPVVVSVSMQCLLLNIYIYICMLYLLFTAASPLLMYVTAVILFYLRRCSYTPALLVHYWYFLRHVTPRVAVFFNFYILSSTLFFYFIFTFFFIFHLQNKCRQVAHVLHLSPRFFCQDISIFDEKNTPPPHVYRTFTARAALRLCGGLTARALD